MSAFRILRGCLLIMLVWTLSGAVLSQGVPIPSALAKATSISADAAFRPGFDDLMTMLIQPRHSKLFFAGSRKNWELAASEQRDLRHAFGRITQYLPKYAGIDVAEAIRTLMDPSLDVMDSAIAAGDTNQFAKAYVALTAACNTCHSYMEHPYHVIKVPAISAISVYPDQEFSASPP